MLVWHMGFADLHAHFLPGLDDGAPDTATSVAMLRGLATIGYDTVTATPHQKAGQFLPDAALIRSTWETTRRTAADLRIPLAIGLGAENYWDHVFYERTRDASWPRYNDGSAFLFEIPVHEVPARFEDTLFQIRVKGFLPVLAHPERYAALASDRERVERLAQNVALVVDLGALAGYHGTSAAKHARALVSSGVAHAAASDVHGPSDVRAAAEGIAWIKAKHGPAAVTRLLDENPRRILAGDLPGA
jgi:protein-tyrosine phosphatase